VVRRPMRAGRRGETRALRRVETSPAICPLPIRHLARYEFFDPSWRSVWIGTPARHWARLRYTLNWISRAALAARRRFASTQRGLPRLPGTAPKRGRGLAALRALRGQDGTHKRVFFRDPRDCLPGWLSRSAACAARPAQALPCESEREYVCACRPGAGRPTQRIGEGSPAGGGPAGDHTDRGPTARSIASKADLLEVEVPLG